MWVQLNVPKPLDEKIETLCKRNKMNEHEVIIDLLIKSTDRIWRNKKW